MERVDVDVREYMTAPSIPRTSMVIIMPMIDTPDSFSPSIGEPESLLSVRLKNFWHAGKNLSGHNLKVILRAAFFIRIIPVKYW